MRLAEAIEHGGLRVGTHADGTYLMRYATRGKKAITTAGTAGLPNNLTPRSLNDRATGLIHIVRLSHLIVAPLETEAQDGDAPLINYFRVNAAIALFVREHGATDSKVHRCSVHAPALLLQFSSITLGMISHPSKLLRCRHLPSTKDLNVISPHK